MLDGVGVDPAWVPDTVYGVQQAMETHFGIQQALDAGRCIQHRCWVSRWSIQHIRWNKPWGASSTCAGWGGKLV